MKTHIIATALLCGMVLPAGCGDNVGLLLKPVSLDQELKETVVQTDGGWLPPKIALIDVDGLIVNQRSSVLWGDGENPVSLFVEKLDKAAEDGAVKAVILRVNSPGGSVQATESMAGSLARFRARTGKPVIACITGVGASGGYYLACGAGRIICQPTGITGSIGVMVQTVSFAGTMKLLGISAEAIASGRLKTMGSPLKDLSEEERKVFQTMIDEFYDQFVAQVAKGRSHAGLSVEEVRRLADGRVYTGQQAERLRLVDQLGDLPQAVEQARKAAGIERARVVMYHRPHGYRANVYAAAPAAAPSMQINLLNLPDSELMFLRRPSFLYLWTTDLSPAARRTPWP